METQIEYRTFSNLEVFKEFEDLFLTTLVFVVGTTQRFWKVFGSILVQKMPNTRTLLRTFLGQEVSSIVRPKFELVRFQLKPKTIQNKDGTETTSKGGHHLVIKHGSGNYIAKRDTFSIKKHGVLHVLLEIVLFYDLYFVVLLETG